MLSTLPNHEPTRLSEEPGLFMLTAIGWGCSKMRWGGKRKRGFEDKMWRADNERKTPFHPNAGIEHTGDHMAWPRYVPVAESLLTAVRLDQPTEGENTT